MQKANHEAGTIAQACRDAVIAFSHRLDHRDFTAAAALFARDGRWDRHGQTLRGRAEILETISARPAETVERHVMTTIDVTVESPVRAVAVSYVLIVRGQADAETTAVTPIPIRRPQSLVEFHDVCELTEEGWRIAHRRARPVFVFTESS